VDAAKLSIGMTVKDIAGRVGTVHAFTGDNEVVVNWRDSSVRGYRNARDLFRVMDDPPALGASTAPAEADPVANPAHYTRYAIEPITFIMRNKLPFAVGNVVKYVLRYDAKNGIEDLKKARRYIDLLIEQLNSESKQA
jgi:hypothetical protein